MTQPSLTEIAQVAGVSLATASRVLNRQADVAHETRKRVEAVMRDRGYPIVRPRASAPRISVNVPVVEAQYFASILGGISEALDAAGMELLLRSPYAREPLAERLAPGTAEGAILVLPPEPLDELLRLQQSGVPFAVIDPRVLLAEGIPCVAAANATGAARAAEHLLELGHERIGLIAGPAGWAATEERSAGVLAAFASGGRLLDPALTEHGAWSIEDGHRGAMKLLTRLPRPTAIFAFNDEMAIGALRAAHELGLQVPDDVSLVGFDDVDRAGLVQPRLTTVRQPLAEMGRLAVSLLLRLLQNRRIQAVRIELATTLVVRASTARSPN